MVQLVDSSQLMMNHLNICVYQVVLKSKFKVVETYCKENGLFFDPALEPVYTDVVEINLAEIEANLSGPKRPQDLIPLSANEERIQ